MIYNVNTGFMLYIVVTEMLFKCCWNVPWCVALSWRTTLRPTTQTSSLYSQLKVFVSSFNGHVTCTIKRARRCLRETRVCVCFLLIICGIRTTWRQSVFPPHSSPLFSQSARLSRSVPSPVSALSSFCSPLMHFLISADWTGLFYLQFCIFSVWFPLFLHSLALSFRFTINIIICQISTNQHKPVWKPSGPFSRIIILPSCWF